MTLTLAQKLYDLKNQRRTKLDAAKQLVMDGKLDSDEYRTTFAGIENLGTQISDIEKLADLEASLGGEPAAPMDRAAAVTPADPVCTGGVLNGLKRSDVSAFAQGIRRAVRNAMTEGSAADGGYTVPEDVVNRIYTLIEAEDNMLPYVTNTLVKKPSGKRTYKKRAQKTGFSTVAEAAKYPAVSGPTFAQIAYEIDKRGGYLPVTVELLEDSDEDIASLVIAWLVDEARVTINKNIVAKAESITPVGLDPTKALDGILRILTVGLGSAFRARSTIHTNDDGLLWLLTLKDKNGRALMNPDPTQPARMLLSVGPINVPIKVWDNATLPTDAGTGKVPFLIGDLKEGIQRFDRKHITIQRLTEATVGTINLAEQDMVAFKATMRDDYQVRDDKAWFFCTVIPGAESALTPVSMAVTTPPTTTEYAAGADFSKTGMVCTVTYSDDSTAVDNARITVLDGEDLAAAQTSVTLLYTEAGVIVSATQAITVTE